MPHVFLKEAVRLVADVCNEATDVEVLASSSAILLLSAFTSFSFEFEAEVAWKATNPLIPATPSEMIEKII